MIDKKMGYRDIEAKREKIDWMKSDKNKRSNQEKIHKKIK
jgi:hypothetical protein